MDGPPGSLGPRRHRHRALAPLQTTLLSFETISPSEVALRKGLQLEVIDAAADRCGGEESSTAWLIREIRRRVLMAGLQCKVVKLLPCPDALEEDLGEHEIEAGHNVTLVCIGSKKTVDGTTDYSPVAGPSLAPPPAHPAAAQLLRDVASIGCQTGADDDASASAADEAPAAAASLTGAAGKAVGNMAANKAALEQSRRSMRRPAAAAESRLQPRAAANRRRRRQPRMRCRQPWRWRRRPAKATALASAPTAELASAQHLHPQLLRAALP